MPQMQELTAGPWQVEPTVVSIRDPELKSTVFWSCSQQNKQSVQCPQCLTQWPLQQKNVPSCPVPRAGSALVVAGC